ncbi:hypothetical protein [Novosphingobium sp.]|uniref:hypothetical protein n=1 Tax=Novosphingobium sp. TaxID=1874826 RepID=UPI003D6CAB9D
MSIARQMRRAADRKKPIEDRRWPRNAQVSRLNPDGSVLTLHPTKGWKRTSAKRVALRIEQAKQQVALQAAIQAVLDGATA